MIFTDNKRNILVGEVSLDTDNGLMKTTIISGPEFESRH